MRFLIDAQLPPRLAQWLKDQKEEALHISELDNGLFMPDIGLWNIARDEGRVIMTKDMDFFELSALHDSPPKVVIMRLGNCSNHSMIEILSKAWISIRDYLNDPGIRLVMLNRESMEIYQK